MYPVEAVVVVDGAGLLAQAAKLRATAASAMIAMYFIIVVVSPPFFASWQ